jgi:hypothetical protein
MYFRASSSSISVIERVGREQIEVGFSVEALAVCLIHQPASGVRARADVRVSTGSEAST